MDCLKDARLDQSQPPPGARLRALRHNRCRIRPHRHDPHHAQAACCNRLVMNPNFPDGLLVARLSGTHWRLMTPPQHLWFFTETSLTRMGSTIGLTLEHVSHPRKIVPL